MSVTVPVPLESQAERRRAHLIAVAAHLIVTQGVDAVSHAAVGEVAGCARTLVYRYFPRREDLLYAILVEFGEQIDARVRREDARAAFVALKNGRRGRMTAESRTLLESLWRPDDWQRDVLEFRLAVVILARDANLRGVIGDHRAAHQESIEQNVARALRTVGLQPIEVDLVVDAMLSAQHHVIKAGLAGQMTREEAIELLHHWTVQAVQAFTR